MKRVIFVGMHNKEGRVPLCSRTKSGQLIDRVIEGVNCECLKTNLYDVDYYPGIEQKDALAVDWHHRICPEPNDIIVLLGAEVHKNFIKRGDLKLLRFGHPASKWSHASMDDYVIRMSDAIDLKLEAD